MITKEEYEEAQEIVWQYEEQLKNNGVLDDVTNRRELLLAFLKHISCSHPKTNEFVVDEFLGIESK